MFTRLMPLALIALAAPALAEAPLQQRIEDTLAKAPADRPRSPAEFKAALVA